MHGQVLLGGEGLLGPELDRLLALLVEVGGAELGDRCLFGLMLRSCRSPKFGGAFRLTAIACGRA
jgi:hypothetical protein